MNGTKDDKTINIKNSDAGDRKIKKYKLFIQDIINKKEYEFTIGRDPHSNDILIDDASISRRHALIYKKGDHFYVKDNGSTNGTFINNEKKTETSLSNQDKIKISGTILKLLQRDIESLFLDNLREKINIDKLTGAYNKQYFEEHLKKLFSLAKRYSKPLSLILFNIGSLIPAVSIFCV